MQETDKFIQETSEQLRETKLFVQETSQQLRETKNHLKK
jgi:hypothetical protein